MLERLAAHRRGLNLLAFAAAAALIALAYFFEYVQGMEPCPLCMFQRVAVAAVGLGFLIAALHAPAGRAARLYAGLLLLLSAVGAAIAGRHLWLQSLPPEQVPACGPGLGYLLDVFPLMEVVQTVLAGSGECAEVERLFGVTLPAWTLAAFVGFGAAAVMINWRTRR